MSPSLKVAPYAWDGEGGQAVVDAMAQKQGAESFGYQGGHAQFTKHRGGRAGRAEAEVASGDQDVAWLYLRSPVRTQCVEDRPGGLGDRQLLA